MTMTLSIGDDRDDIDLPERDIDDDRDGDDDPEDGDRSKGNDQRADQDSDADDDEDDDRSPEELKAEIKRLKASLAKSNSTGLRRRNQLKALRDAQQAQASQDDSDDEDEGPVKQKPAADDGRLDAKQVERRIERARKEALREAEAAHTRDLIDTRAESALSKAGADEKAIRLLKRELDYDDLELDPKTRAVDGLDEEVDRLRTEFPNLFRGGKAARRRINGGDDRDSGKRQRPLSPSEVQARQLRGL